MARGWESKSVESQIEAVDEFAVPGPRLTPEQAERQREREGVLLSMTRLNRQIETSTNPRYTRMLKKALTELEAKLKALDKPSGPAQTVSPRTKSSKVSRARTTRKPSRSTRTSGGRGRAL